MYRIMIIEDDQAMADVMKKQMEAWGNEAECVRDFQDILSAFTQYDPHLILMDIMLPFFNGYHWCSEIRKISNVPVVFISSAADNMNIVMAMNLGGDDFIAKPFDLQVLTAKVQALLRRAKRPVGLQIASGELVYDMGRHQVYKRQEILPLTPIELQLVQSLLLGWPQTLSRERIFDEVWDKDGSYVDENTLSVNISRLRDKLGTFQGEAYIETVRGIGYRWAVHVQR